MKRYVAGIGWIRSQPLQENAILYRDKRIRLIRKLVPVLKEIRDEGIRYRVRISEKSVSTYVYFKNKNDNFLSVRFSDHRNCGYHEYDFVSEDFNFDQEKIRKAIKLIVQYLKKMEQQQIEARA